MILMEGTSRLQGLEHAETWYIALPDSTCREAKAAPLVLFLHDNGRDGTQLARLTQLEAIVEETGAAFLMPSGMRSCFVDMRYGPHWRRYLSEGLLPFVTRSFAVEGQVYALGIGTGGWAAAHLMEKEPKWIKACAGIDAMTDLPKAWADGRLCAPDLAAVFGEKDSGDPAAYDLKADTIRQAAWLHSADNASITDAVREAVKGFFA